MLKKIAAIGLCAAMAVSSCSTAVFAAGKPSPSSYESQRAGLRVGEPWNVKNEWNVVVTSIKETTKRIPGKEAVAAYVVSYEYTNLGYTDPAGKENGLILEFDDIRDKDGNEGHVYPLKGLREPAFTPVGATCKAEVAIELPAKGGFSAKIEKRDSEEKMRAARFAFTENDNPVAPEQKKDRPNPENAFGVGDTWTVDGQVSFELTGIRAVDELDEDFEQKPAAVYEIDYICKNLGFTNADGTEAPVNVSLDRRIVDAEGVMGYPYLTKNEVNASQDILSGEECDSRIVVAVDHEGKISFQLSVPDKAGVLQTQWFTAEA